MTVDVVTFGCRLNAYESEVIKARAAQAGLANAIVVNTCAVTAEAVRQSRQEIRKLKQQSGGKIAIIGSATLVHSLLDAGLIDEIEVLVHPLVLGKGVRLFADGYHSPMKLTDSKILSNGVVYLSYQIEHQT